MIFRACWYRLSAESSSQACTNECLPARASPARCSELDGSVVIVMASSGGASSREHRSGEELRMATNRREFLHHAAGALTGLAVTGCSLMTPAFSQTLPRRREMVVDGKRVRTVDVHAHCHIPEANELMGLKAQLPSLVISPERIKAMDGQGIDVEALSINPIFWYKA